MTSGSGMASTTCYDDPALAITGLSKRYPGVQALDGVDLDVRYGEIHALVGENGAGKSTLVKILAGLVAADRGQTSVDGIDVALRTPSEAIAAGVTVVHQDVTVIPGLSVGRNILLGEEATLCSRGRLAGDERQRVERVLGLLGARIDPDTRAADLSVAEHRLVQLARGLVEPGGVLVLDEPTAVLSASDSEQFLARIRLLREQGSAVVYVSHRLNEILDLADRVTVLRDGKKLGTWHRSELNRARLVSLMARDGSSSAKLESSDPTPGQPLLRVLALSGGILEAVSVSVAAGEVLGIAGVQGSGHGSLLRAIAGVDTPANGSVEVEGKRVRAGSPRHAYRAGIVWVPADRRGAGVVTTTSIRENLSLPVTSRSRRFGLRHLGRERATADSYVARFSIKAPHHDVLTGTLSGGNQQKVAIAKALEARPRVLLVEEPTQGIDIGAKAEIAHVLQSLAREKGLAIVLATSDFEEILDVADRIVVMREGRTVAEIARKDADYQTVLHHALG